MDAKYKKQKVRIKSITNHTLTSKGFTICAADDILWPLALNQEKLFQEEQERRNVQTCNIYRMLNGQNRFKIHGKARC